MASHQMRGDGNGINVAGWEGANDSLVVKESQLVSITFTGMTTPTGQINVPTTPIAALGRQLDYFGNLTNNFGITVLDAGNGTTYYTSTVDPSAGLITVVTSQGGSTTVNSTNVKVTYFYLAPVEGTLNADGTVSPNVYIQSNIIVPVDVQNHLTQLVQNFNAVSVGASTASGEASFHPCDGYAFLNIGLLNDASTSNYLDIQWSYDGTNYHSADYGALPTATTQRRTVQVPVKAPYFRLSVYNGDTVAHTFSVWSYLMA